MSKESSIIDFKCREVINIVGDLFWSVDTQNFACTVLNDPILRILSIVKHYNRYLKATTAQLS